MSEQKHYIDRLLVALHDARKFADSEFMVCLKQGESLRAIYFGGLKEILRQYIKMLEDYKEIVESEELNE